MAEILKGGKGDYKKASDFDPEEVKMGIAHEMEHTDDEAVAREICYDHLTENPSYYSKLKKAKLESIIESFIYVSFRLFESIPNNFRIRRRI